MKGKYKFVVGIIVDPNFKEEDFAVMFRFPKENMNTYDAYRTCVLSAESYDEMREMAIKEIDKVLSSYKPKKTYIPADKIAECTDSELAITDLGGGQTKPAPAPKKTQEPLPVNDSLFMDLQ